tara:strand:- start:62 stop:253 length:192 start_codon:yes stop_codon:yes gene_type:complete
MVRCSNLFHNNDINNDDRIKMVEWLRHMLGLCGEPHPSLITLLMGTPMLGYVIYKIRQIRKKR